MTGRAALVSAFLDRAGWGSAVRTALAGDASSRCYTRLTLGSARAVLMDASPALGEDVTRFTRMARWLSDRGYSAPAVLVEDAPAGLVLLEDLGDALFARLTDAEPGLEAELYGNATAFLADLHRHRPPSFVAPLDAAGLSELVSLTPLWYPAGVGASALKARDRLPGLISAAAADLDAEPQVTALRDFHAENLIWLPERNGVARVGLLDFQDAVAAHPAYDLVSLLQDARRDVSAATEAREIARYCDLAGTDPDRFTTAYRLLGAQRNLRILGVFARLCLQMGKPRYLEFMPRVWGHLERDLSHPALAMIAHAVHEGLPEPTPGLLQRMRDECGTHPAP